jgi:ubiquinone/menaquinone biosynthesis C-methylase UbiE
MVSAQRWNSNLHAFEMLTDFIPADAKRGLDVGCGEGETTRRLRRHVPSVVGLDPDPTCIDEARSYNDDIDYMLGRLETVELPEASFDVVTAVAMLHHVDQAEGLRQLRRLVRPGGAILVVGLARSRSLGDFGRDAFDAIAVRRHTLTKGVWETPAPKVWPPPLTYAQTRTVSLDVLPGARFRRLPHFRYGLTWTSE